MTSSTIILSIVVPFYNTAQYLPKCIESIVHQDLPLDVYEIILIDDGSTDGSLAIAQQYASQYANIKVLTQNNKGSSSARNLGITSAQGTYFRFVDSDDYLPKNNLRQFLLQMEREQLDILRFDYQLVDEQYQPIAKLASAQHIDYSSGIVDGEEFLLTRLGYACYSCPYIFRHNVIKDIMFCVGDYFDDVEWMPRVCQNARRVNSTEEIGYYYFQRTDSLVRDVAQSAIERKIEGLKFLVKELSEQKSSSPTKVAPWYDGMIAHCTVTLLNTVARHRYLQVNNTIDFLRKQGVFPLTTYKSEPKTARKIQLINIAPRLYCSVLHLKNK